MRRLAILSFHGCPVARLGEKDTGGMNVYVLQLARELARQGTNVDVFTRYHDPNDPKVVQLEEGARVIHLKAGPIDAAKEDLFDFIPEFLGELYAFQRSEDTTYDLVHSHYWLSGRVGMTLSQKWDVPHVTTFHTLAKTKLRARVGEREPMRRVNVESLVMQNVDAIVVSTEEEKQDVVRLYDAVPRKVSVVPAGVDLDLFEPIEKPIAREALGIREKRVILYVGRIERLKGIEILLRSAALVEDIADTRVLIVGGHPENDTEQDRLRALTAELGLQDVVTFTGAVEQAELPNYYNAADAFVLPSHSESFGLAALEAMACGTPVVASRVGGLKTFIDSGETGYLVPWRCPEPFAQRLEMLLANPELKNAMGTAARAKALKMGWGHTADRMLECYSGLSCDSWESVAGD
ncbi:MAG: glycosyltransferase family 1 protein [SAR202 cluster bacterium]|nr:glycosyltransferase [SAR202 cluster bacterium]MDP6663662.1 glycosyltransferase [SAR202 cluster bacterium]MQG68501.1 glycosyltransferase family 1 protein [SAR202 cluster bacterium]